MVVNMAPLVMVLSFLLLEWGMDEESDSSGEWCTVDTARYDLR